ncbi:MAG TPA: 3'-5' exonuclease, partial [Thermoplasmata archaeon]|nr:3'-5' exonuclease [Thermoplasmata archaeon]
MRKRLEILDQVKEIREVERRVDIGSEDAVPVLEVVPRHYRELQDIAKIVDSNGGYHDYPLYNVDLRFGQRYCLKHGIFPFGLLWYGNGKWRAEEEQFALDYPLPKLRPALLDLRVDAPLGIPRFQDKLLGARVGDIEVSGSEPEILEKLNAAVKELDPDVVLTDNGDAFLMPYLARKAAEHKVPLQLGRDPDRFVEKRGRSYFTYGKIVYKPGQYLLKGRLHLDRGHFAYREAAMAGLAELSRMSLLMPQEQARLTPGTAISAMQVNLATRDGCLVIWKKNRPEDFKTAEDLILGD